MFDSKSAEIEVDVPASEVWKFYTTLEFPKIVEKTLPSIISKIDVVQGDGGAGTIVEIWPPAEADGKSTSCKEKITVLDHANRVRVAEVVEGGYLDLGFTMHRVRIEVIEKEKKKNCICRVTIEYDLKEEAAANAAFISTDPLVTVMQVVADRARQNN